MVLCSNSPYIIVGILEDSEASQGSSSENVYNKLAESEFGFKVRTSKWYHMANVYASCRTSLFHESNLVGSEGVCDEVHLPRNAEDRAIV